MLLPTWDGGCLTDVPGIAVGHHQRNGRGWRTGTTVIVVPAGTVAGVDVRGGGPGTRETDLLDPHATIDTIHAVCLTGGSTTVVPVLHPRPIRWWWPTRIPATSVRSFRGPDPTLMAHPAVRRAARSAMNGPTAASAVTGSAAAVAPAGYRAAVERKRSAASR